MSIMPWVRVKSSVNQNIILLITFTPCTPKLINMYIKIKYKYLLAVGGTIYEIIKLVKIGNKRTDFLTQECGVRQGCNLSTTLCKIYINKLERSTANKVIKFLLCGWQCSGSAVAYRTRDTAQPRSARAVLSDLGPGSKCERLQFSEKTQISGKWILI